MASGDLVVLRDGQGRAVPQVRSSLEALRFAVGFATAGSGVLLSANTRKTAGVDKVGEASGVGGLTLVEGDANMFKGEVPANTKFEPQGLSLRLHKLDFSAVPADAEIQAMNENTRVYMYVGQTKLDLGLAAEWYGPFGSPTGLNNAVNVRKFGWQWGPSFGIELEAGTQFKLDFEILRDISSIVTVSKTYVYRGFMPARITRQADQAFRAV